MKDFKIPNASLTSASVHLKPGSMLWSKTEEEAEEFSYRGRFW